MREFLRGWRRKAGCVTLILACLSVLLWARSYWAIESVRFGSPRHHYEIAFVDGEVHLSQDIDWHSRLLIVPYWPMTIPLTLLAAYLILWNPRPKPKGEPDA